MKTTVKITSDTKSKDETPKSTRPANDNKLKKSVYTVSTPRSYVHKSTAADIYAQKKQSTLQSAKAPKKLPGTSHSSSNESPMKDLLKSSPSSVSHISRSSDKKTLKKNDGKSTSHSGKKTETPRKKDLLVNVTVNSPVAKRRLDLNKEHATLQNITRDVSNVKKKEKITKEAENITDDNPKKNHNKEVLNAKTENNSKKAGTERQRTKTRTLNENEVKMLTPDVVDNNAEMLNLSRKLTAKSKVFYVDLDGEPSKKQINKSSDEEVSYEDDFESYESDFDSYHSEQSQSNHSSDLIDDRDGGDEIGKKNGGPSTSGGDIFKEVKDEERMLDSGSFDLREQRSAKTKPAVLDYIHEDAEDAAMKKTSLTDEGFQEMSSSSAVSSLRTVHTDVLDRPLFIDFTKSKENKRKRRINERLKQRAKDLLSMITLHKMSYSLFEMKPISYDLYMATFGRSNYTQSAVQTFDDGISQEVQTEEIMYSHKWTQNPVEFSKHDVYLNKESKSRKYSENIEDYITKFTFLVEQNCDVEINAMTNLDENYKENPLRVYFEQKDGVGTGDLLPYETYKSKLNNNEYKSDRLRKFLKKFESRINYVLSTNTGNNDSSDLVKSTKIPFSRGYVSISPKIAKEEKFTFLKLSEVTRVIFSQTKSNLILTVHKKADTKKCIICLWDISFAIGEPLKILIAIDNVIIGKFRGNTDGIFIAALEDGSIHLWDLSEEPTWREGVSSKENTSELEEINSAPLTETEKDREWNLKNVNVGINQSQIQCALQACAYTSSAYNMSNGYVIDCIVGLESIGDERAPISQDGGQKIIGQVISLQRIGIITIWCMVQEKAKKCTQDIGKAFWSKIKLEKSQIIPLQEYVDVTLVNSTNNYSISSNFNLHAAKRRLSNRKQERNVQKKVFSRPKSSVDSNFEFDFDRPTSAAGINRKVLPVEKSVAKRWESGIICSDLKIIRLNDVVNFLVARNCGEVICCRRCLGSVKVERFCVANDMSSVTCLEVSPHGLSYFLAATDTGTVNLYSLLESRVLLTLDCRNVPQNQSTDKCQSDHKGRYISSVATRTPNISVTQMKISVSSVLWSHVNPCCVYALMQDGAFLTFDLTHSDIYAKSICEKAATACDASDTTLALLTPEGEVQAHRLTNEHQTKEYLELFEKYVALL